MRTGCLALVLVLGCGAGKGAGGAGGGLTIVFPKLYSSFDGVHRFKVPAMVEGVKGVKWTTANPALVQIDALTDEGSTGSEAMLTVKGAGTTTIDAAAGGLTGSAPLTVTASTSASWDIGRARYQDGIMIVNPRMVEKTAACTNCHGSGTMDIEHTPAQTGGYSDEELVIIITEGRKPPGVVNRVIPVEQWHRVHQWQLNEDEKKGVVVFLRSLEPHSQGTVDFGGRGVFRPEIDGGAAGDGGSSD
jgi:hypothetical protein